MHYSQAVSLRIFKALFLGISFNYFHFSKRLHMMKKDETNIQ